MMQACMLCVRACKAAQGIWDDVFLIWLVSDIKLELLDKLKCSHKSQIESHYWGGRYNQELLKYIRYCGVICLNDYVQFG